MSIENFIKTVCVQPAVLWTGKQADGFGKHKFTEVREISVRWDDKIKLVIGRDGREVLSTAQLLVTEDLPLESMVKLGKLADMLEPYYESEGDTPNPVEVLDPYALGAVEIKTFSKIPMIKKTDQFVRTVYL